MFFETYPYLEVDDVNRKRLYDCDVRFYRGILLSPEAKFFIVEICYCSGESKDEDDCDWSTILLNNFDTVIEHIDHHLVTKSRINLFVPPRYNDNNECGFYKISKIYRGMDCENRDVVAYHCENGKIFTSPPVISGNELKQKTCIYPLNKFYR